MTRTKQLDGQMQFDVFEASQRHEPFNCQHELKTVDIGGGKSLCELMDSWTNCREVRRCVHDVIHGKL